MKKFIFYGLIIYFFIISCSGINNDFLLSENQVGVLKRDTRISEIAELYKGDFSIENHTPEYINVLEKDKNILKITPNKENQDKIYTIEILSDRFKTIDGISLKSTFKEIQEVYKNLEVGVTFKNLVLSPVNSNISFVFDKSSLMASKTGVYGLEDIPQGAMPKQMHIFWFDK